MSTNERPPLWRALPQRMGAYYSSEIRAVTAMQIRAVAQYLLDHCPTYIDTDGKPAFRMGARRLEMLEEEAKRAEAGE